MSVMITRAIYSCGPQGMRRRRMLLVIAHKADDFGFACPSFETVAHLARVSVRTARRRVQELECEGWIKVRRKTLDGKGNVYFINTTKLGVVASAKMRKSSLHIQFEKQLEAKAAADPRQLEAEAVAEAPVQFSESGDNLSCENFAVSENSGDNSQGVQGTNSSESEDKIASPFNSINRKEPLKNHTPPTPLTGGE